MNGYKKTRTGLHLNIKSKRRNFLIISSLIFLIKILVIARISTVEVSGFTGKFWLGADGENYLNGVKALTDGGLFSKDGILNYWPAGYPLFIWIFGFFGKNFILTFLVVFQSLIYSIAVFSFANQIIHTRLVKITNLLTVTLLLSPTLSMSSLVIGYESLAASGYLLIASLFIWDFRVRTKKSLLISVGFSALTISFQSFIQPRLILAGMLILIYWIFVRQKNILKIFFIITIAFFLVTTLPASLIIRNHFATGVNSISTNLGNTMKIGAGETSGGYVKNPPGVPCDNSDPNPSKADNKLVRCVLDWYTKNPVKALKLFYNKSIFFWSPWFGPLANGTMARNPWLTIHPLKNTIKTQEGFNLVYGFTGTFISWLWLIGGLMMAIFGYLHLRKYDGVERHLGNLALFAIMCSWLVTLISIGDHRFRLPILTMSIFLQVVGLSTRKKSKQIK